MLEDDDEHPVLKRARDLLISGAIGGGLLGAGAKFFHGGKTLSDLGKAGLKGAALAGPLSAAAGLTGGLIHGEPEPGEQGANSHRGLTGGALLGAGLGGLAGAAYGGGAVQKSPEWLKKFLGFVGKEAPTENLAGEAIRRYATAPSKLNALKGAAVGGAAGGSLGGFIGWDEGNQLDFAESQSLRQRRAKERALRRSQNA